MATPDWFFDQTRPEAIRARYQILLGRSRNFDALPLRLAKRALLAPLCYPPTTRFQRVCGCVSRMVLIFLRRFVQICSKFGYHLGRQQKTKRGSSFSLLRWTRHHLG